MGNPSKINYNITRDRFCASDRRRIRILSFWATQNRILQNSVDKSDYFGFFSIPPPAGTIMHHAATSNGGIIYDNTAKVVVSLYKYSAPTKNYDILRSSLFELRNMRVLAVSGCILPFNFPTTRWATLKMRSDGADVAGIARNFLASRARVGNDFCLSDHHHSMGF
jgi:hypothetical protein